ncbi:DUF350 domain-containing protein [Flindersiella endophytica]
MIDILQEAGIGLAYGVVGIALMGLGFVLVDLLTPGKLSKLIWTDRNVGAAAVLGAQLLGVGLIVATAILSSEGGFGTGLASTLIYGLIGILLMGLAFLVIDLVTPGKLGDTVVETQTHPAAWVVAAAYLSIAGIVAAAIS